MVIEDILKEIAEQERALPVKDKLGHMIAECVQEDDQLGMDALLKVTAARGEDTHALELKILEKIRKAQ